MWRDPYHTASWTGSIIQLLIPPVFVTLAAQFIAELLATSASGPFTEVR